GSGSVVIRDALPAHDFYYVARAIDAAGNEDSNTNEAKFQTDDHTPPDFGGVETLVAISATSLQITWGVAYDATAPDSALVYEVYVKVDAKPKPGKDPVTYTSKPGEHSVTLTEVNGDPVQPLTTYHVIVRVKDPN